MQRQKNKQAQTQVSDLVELVDNSFRLDFEIKEKTKVLKGNKEKLKHIALREGKSKLSGELGVCEFMNDTKTEIEPKALYDLLVEIGQSELFFDLVKVNITAAKARIGEMLLEGIWEQTTTKNAKIKFKKVK